MVILPVEPQLPNNSAAILKGTAGPVISLAVDQNHKQAKVAPFFRSPATCKVKRPVRAQRLGQIQDKNAWRPSPTSIAASATARSFDLLNLLLLLRLRGGDLLLLGAFAWRQVQPRQTSRWWRLRKKKKELCRLQDKIKRTYLTCGEVR